MATSFPGSDDSFTEPSSPGSTALASAGTGSRSHTQHHADLGNAIEAMQAEATLLVHSHDGSTARHGSKLLQANTHQTPDTDTGTSSLHHTIGAGANQSAAGNHTHIQATSHNSPDTDSATSSLHHTIGTGANQAAAGDHAHAHPITLYIKTTQAFTKATYSGLYAVEVEAVGGGGGSGGAATTSGTQMSAGMPGSAGAYARALILASDLLSSETVTIGAGGAGGTSTTNGSSGTATSFGSHFSCGGGSGGTKGSAVTNQAGGGGAAGGSPSGTYDVGIPGESGETTFIIASGPLIEDASLINGRRSGGPWGHSQKVDGNGSSTAHAGSGYGNGASPPINGISTSGKSGAAGSVGLCVIRLIF